MIGTLLRVFAGFILASFAAGLALVLHADTPNDIMVRAGGGVPSNDELSSIALMALKAGTHIAIFSAPLALIAAAIAEWQRARGIWFYLLAGLAIAAGGFMAQHMSETVGQHTVLNEYAMRAFGLAGLAAGLAYWAVAGRCAGGCGGPIADEIADATRGEVAPAKSAAAAEPAAQPSAAQPAVGDDKAEPRKA